MAYYSGNRKSIQTYPYYSEDPIELEDAYPGRRHSNEPESRRSPRTCRSIFGILFFSALLAVINGFLVTWLLFYVPRVTRPYDYPEFAFGNYRKPNAIALFVLLFVLSPLNAVFVYCLFVQLAAAKLECKKSRDPNAQTGAGCGHIFFGGLLMILALIWPLCCFTNIPDNIWNKMMKDTCIGFDSRVKTLDKRMGEGKYSWMVRDHRLEVYHPGGSHPKLHIGSHITQHIQDPLDHYQNFFRITGSTPHTEHISVDFDFDHRIWRMFESEDEDYKDAWYAEGRYDKRKTKPVIHQLSAMLPTDKLIKSGTWSKPTTRSNHTLTIPELEIQIPQWYGFTQTWAFEPFLKMHRISNMTTEEIQKQSDAKWTKFNDETVVMRTAAFGHGQRATSVCIRGEDWEENGVVHKGLGDDMLVPLGLLALYRIKFQDENLRETTHFFSGNGAHQDILT